VRVSSKRQCYDWVQVRYEHRTIADGKIGRGVQLQARYRQEQWYRKSCLRAEGIIAGFSEYETYDAIGLAGLIAGGQVSATEVLEAAIERAERWQPSINSSA